MLPRLGEDVASVGGGRPDPSSDAEIAAAATDDNHAFGVKGTICPSYEIEGRLGPQGRPALHSMIVYHQSLT